MSAAGNDETILVVEDEPSVQALSRRILTRAGFRVLVASSPSEALALAEQRAGEIDLVLSDVAMPEMTGPELVTRLGQFLPGVNALFVSGYTAEDVVREGLGTGALNLLPKPFSPQQLVERVRAALDA